MTFNLWDEVMDFQVLEIHPYFIHTRLCPQNRGDPWFRAFSTITRTSWKLFKTSQGRQNIGIIMNLAIL